jgi:hypothetical protein
MQTSPSIFVVTLEHLGQGAVGMPVSEGGARSLEWGSGKLQVTRAWYEKEGRGKRKGRA